MTQHDPQNRRKKSHQHDVERKHVQIDGLEFEDEALPQRLGRVVDQARDVELVDDLQIAKSQREVTDRCDIDHEQNDVGDVELPDTLGQAGGADDETALKHHSSIDE